MPAAPVTLRSLLNISAEFPSAAGLPGPCEAGTLSIDLTIENSSHVPAQLPFLCVTDLGLNIHPVRAGRMEKIAADGRRLVRFGFESHTVLKPGDKLAICQLICGWRGCDAPVVSFDLGSGHPLDSLRDLRILCVSGAANFPSERSYLVLPAASIRKAIESQLSSTSARRAVALGV